MKKVISACTIFLLLGTYGLIKLQFNPFLQQDKKISIQVVYKDNVYAFEVQPYTLLGDVLSWVDLDEDAHISALNETQILHHNDKIVIPIFQEIPCISINHANQEELMQITGIGPKMAERIIAYRTEYGYFQKIEEIMEVKGIGEKSFSKMKDRLCI